MAKVTQPIFIASARRTPIGAYLGALADVAAPALGATAIRAALETATVAPTEVDEVYLGNVLSAGVGQAPARQASLTAGILDSTPCTTVNKVCGSGMQAVILGAKALLLGDAEVVVAGGMESMSRVPYYLTKGRTGYRMGNSELVDGMIFDGLWDPYKEQHMGIAGELCAGTHDCSREAQDRFATESYQRALAATAAGKFRAELCAVEVPGRKETARVAEDEEPARGKPEKFGALKPAFTKDGTITAANASSINDGAAALVLATEGAVTRLGLKPIARLVGYGGAAQSPDWFTTAPVKAIENTLASLAMSPSDIDLWEINEAFSCVTMACAKLSGIELDKVNVHGGAVALGHPIGATGARILVTLIHALRDRGARRGLGTLCIGGGEALAVVVETV